MLKFSFKPVRILGLDLRSNNMLEILFIMIFCSTNIICHRPLQTLEADIYGRRVLQDHLKYNLICANKRGPGCIDPSIIEIDPIVDSYGPNGVRITHHRLTRLSSNPIFIDEINKRIHHIGNGKYRLIDSGKPCRPCKDLHRYHHINKQNIDLEDLEKNDKNRRRPNFHFDRRNHHTDIVMKKFLKHSETMAALMNELLTNEELLPIQDLGSIIVASLTKEIREIMFILLVLIIFIWFFCYVFYLKQIKPSLIGVFKQPNIRHTPRRPYFVANTAAAVAASGGQPVIDLRHSEPRENANLDRLPFTNSSELNR